MALKSDRRFVDGDISFFMNEVAERGGIVVPSTVGSGAAMDQSEALATYAALPSGSKPLGCLMSEMVDIDLTRQHENWHKEEVVLGGKVNVWAQGVVVTDRIFPNDTPTANSTAYLAHSGLIGTADHVGGNIVVGEWQSSADEDGYAKLYVHK